MKRRIVDVASALALATIGLPVGVVLAQNADQRTQVAQGANTSAATSDQSAQSNGAAASGELQEVVVTAERRAVNLQATPIAITAISGDQVQNLHLQSLEDIQTTVPAFTDSVAGNGQFSTLNIRGVGSAIGGTTAVAGVAIYRDGVLFNDPWGEAYPLFDIADTEVLEGPQGTLVGGNSTAGALEINSANPTFTGLNGYLLGGVANYSEQHLQGAINLPVTDSFAARLAFDHDKRNSFYYDVGASTSGFYYQSYSATAPQTDGPPKQLLQGVPGQSLPVIDPGHVNGDAFRLSMLWKPTDNFQALAKINYYYIDTGGEPAEPNPGTYQTAFAAGSGPTYAGCTTQAGTTFTGSQLSCPSAGVMSHSTYYYPGEQAFQLDYYGLGWEWNEIEEHGGLDLKYTLPNGIELRSMSGAISQLALAQQAGSYGPQNTGWQWWDGGPNASMYSEEVNVISPTTGAYAKLNWIVGAWYNYRRTPVSENFTSVSAPYQPTALPTQVSYGELTNTVYREEAIFGQINWQITDALQFQVGARENWDSGFSGNYMNIAPPAGTVLPDPFGSGVYRINYNGSTPVSYTVLRQLSLSGKFTDSVPTGKVGLSWTPAQGQNFYLFYARGYKTGGVNSSSLDHPFFNPEEVNDWELGWKGRLFDGHMVTQVGAYYYNYQGLQFPLYDTEAQNDTSTGTYVANLGNSTLYGLEASEQARFGGLGFNASVAYGHSQLGNATTVPYNQLPAGWGSPNPLPQCLAGHTYAAGTQCFDYTGSTVNVAGESNPYAPLWTAFVAVDYQFHLNTAVIDPRVTFSHTDKQYVDIFENSYTEMGARNLLGASVDFTEGTWNAQLYGTNLANLTYIVGKSTGASSLVYYGAPRQFGLQVTKHF